MIRIRGRIGDLPVDLEVTLDSEDWQQLRQGVRGDQPAAAPPAPAAPPAADPAWEAAQQLLRQHVTLDGPTLLAELRALVGSDQAAKRLLVRLRHNAAVTVTPGEGAPLFRWNGEPDADGARPEVQ